MGNYSKFEIPTPYKIWRYAEIDTARHRELKTGLTLSGIILYIMEGG